jgi:hypothetical protein
MATLRYVKSLAYCFVGLGVFNVLSQNNLVPRNINYLNSKTRFYRSLLLASSLAYPMFSKAKADSTLTQQALCTDLKTIDNAANLISKYCTTTLIACKDVGKLLYRGESVQLSGPHIIATGFDLIEEGTYANPVAVDFFRNSDSAMRERNLPISPSMGHLATSNPLEASKWGSLCSIWPLDK